MASPLVHPIEGARLLRTHSTGEDVRGNEREGSRQVRECIKARRQATTLVGQPSGPPAIFTEAKPIFALGCCLPVPLQYMSVRKYNDICYECEYSNFSLHFRT